MRKYRAFLILTFIIICYITTIHAQDKYAILISPGRSVSDDSTVNSEYWCDFFLAYKMLFEKGFSHSEIYACYGDGQKYDHSLSTYQVPSEWGTIIDFNNDSTTLESVFESVGNVSTNNDYVVIYWVVGHGTHDYNGTGQGNDNYAAKIENVYSSSVDTAWIPESVLINWVDEIDHYKRRLIFWCTCHSGCLIEGNLHLSGTKSFVFTSTGYMGISFLKHTDVSHARFSYFLTGYLYGSAPNDGYWDDYTANNNSDSYISMNELYNSVYDSVTASKRDGMDDYRDHTALWFTIPSEPTNFRITNAGQVDSNPNLAWDWTDEGSGKERFKIYRSTIAYQPYNWSLIDSTTDTTYTDTEVIIKDSADADDKYIYHSVMVDTFSRNSAQSVYVSTWGESFQKKSMKSNNENEKILIPNEYVLYQNYPNPFNASTNIKFQIPKSENVNLTVYDILGREIKILINKNMDAGYYRVTWNTNYLSSGIYFYKLKAGNFIEVKRMLLLK